MSLRKMMVFVVSIGALGVVLFFLLPKSNCEDSTPPEMQKLIDRADTGDMVAIIAMYNYNKSIGIKPFEEYWALRGALQGDSSLRREYVQFFKAKKTQDEKDQTIKAIQQDASKPGALCLIAVLKNDQASMRLCK